jgi:hypothetical protein
MSTVFLSMTRFWKAELLCLKIDYQMPDSPQRDPRAQASVWAPFGWAAILTLILAGGIFSTKNLHSLSSHIGEFIVGILLLPVALVFVLLGKVAGNFLVWLSGVPDWLLFTLITADAYLYCLIAMMLLWIMIRLAKRRRRAKKVA